MAEAAKKPSSRILALDYLRGFFIAVIIIDHLWRWPNLFQGVTGRGELWVTAAEGFVIISGLLVGYVYGFKKRAQPLKETAIHLVKRGFMLYLWMVITTVALVWVNWNLPVQTTGPYIPIEPNNWSLLFEYVLPLSYVHSLTHFLYLYAIFLIISPGVIWLLRRRGWALIPVLSALGWYLGITHNIEWLQWQPVFFLPAVVGYYLEPIQAWLGSLKNWQLTSLKLGFLTAFLASAYTAAQIILPTVPGAYQEPFFTHRPLAAQTIGLAFIWFLGILSLFSYITPLLKRTVGWLFTTFGERSLTAYIVHTIPLVAMQLLFPPSIDPWFNSVSAIVCVLATWALLKIPGINRVIPR